jgi:hypothetical protein
MKDRVFRDPVHGLIELRGDDRRIEAVLATRAVQRLRRIRQLGFAWLVYPGAEHSRFGHALGAFHVAQRVVRKLELPAELALQVKVAALLHDVGHGPFSHAWEHVFPGGDHEAWGARIVAEDGELRAALDQVAPGLAGGLGRFWTGGAPRWARKLVSSQLDVDRLDYLLRDGHYTGAGYATYDLDWIIHAMGVEAIHGGPDGDDLVVDYRRGMYAVEQYLFARSYMFAQVYHHKTVRAAEWMFIKLMQRFGELARSGGAPAGMRPVAALARGEAIVVPDYLWLDDVAVIGALDAWAGQGEAGPAGAAADPVLRDLALRLVRRRLFKTVELGDDPAVMPLIEAEAAAVAARRFGAAGGCYYQLDHARQLGYLPGDDEELYVVGHPRRGTTTLGALLSELPLGRPISTVRLVCAAEIVDELRPICERALRSVSSPH